MTQTPSVNVTFRASVSLMEDYRMGTELSPDSALTQVVNAAGEGELFYTGIDGQGDIVIYNVYPDSSSDTGWSVASINPDFIPGQTVGGVDAGDFTLFCLGPDASNPDINFVRRDAKGNWGTWQHVDASSVYNTLTPPCYVRNVVAGVVDGNLELVAVLSDSRGGMTMWRVDWKATLGGWQQMGRVDSPLLDFCSTAPWGAGVLGVRVNDSQPTTQDLLLFPVSGADPAMVAAQQHIRSADSSLVTPAATGGTRYSGVFIYNDGATGGSQGISYIDCSAASPRPVVIDTSLTVEQMIAVDAGSNPISLMVVDQDMRLNVISHDDSSPAWNPAIELGDTLNSIAAGLAANGSPLVFAVNAKGNALFSMLKQPLQEGGRWTKQPIEAQVQRVEKISVYGTSFTLMDANGNTLANQAMALTSPETMVVGWQGESYVIGERSSLPVTTDNNGQIVLYAPTGSINAGKLLFSVPGLLGDGQAIAIDADAHARDRLKAITKDETTNLLPDKYKRDAANVQQAINAAMSYEALPQAGYQVKGARLVAAGANALGYERPLDPSSGAVEHWHFSVRDGRASFQRLTAAEAQALRQRLIAEGGGKPASLNGWFDWLGDIVEAVVNAVETAIDWVVTKVKEVVEATINCIINGVKYVFDGVIQTIERAFQIAEAIFGAVLVFFERLFSFLAWLLSGARQDIWNTKKVFEGIINQSFPALSNLAVQGKSSSAGFFANLKQTLGAQFDSAIRYVGSDTFNYKSDTIRKQLSTAVAAALAAGGSTAASAGTPLGELGLSPGDVVQFVYDCAVQANWFIEKLLSPLLGFDIPIDMPQSIQASFAAFAASLAAAIGPAITSEMAVVASYFESIATNPAAFMSTTIAAALTAVKNLVMLVLDTLDSLSQSFFDLVISFLQVARPNMFDKPVGGFFLQALYDLMNPEGSETLTVTRLVAYTCAFPSTIICRLLTGRSPYSLTSAADLGRSDGADVAKLVAGSLLASAWWVVDSWNDLPGDMVYPDSHAVIGSVAIPIVFTALLSPGDSGPFSTPPWDTDLNKAKNTKWCLSWATIAFSTIWVACTRAQGGPRGTAPGCAALFLFGAASTGVGIWKGVAEGNAGQSSAANWFNDIAPAINMFKGLKHAGPWGVGALLVLDAVADCGTGGILIAQQIASDGRIAPRSDRTASPGRITADIS